MTEELVKGDIIRVWRFFYWHYGIYVDKDCVIHYSCAPFHWWQASAKVKKTSLVEFLGKKGREKIFYRCEKDSDKIIQRAIRKLGEEQYSLLFNNCKHFVEYCISD